MLSQENEVGEADPSLSRRRDLVSPDLSWPMVLWSKSSFLFLVPAGLIFFLCRVM